MRRLTARQLEGVAHTQRVILSYDSYSDPRVWMRDVNTELKSLLQSELATFVLSTPSCTLSETDLPPDIWSQYLSDVAAVDVAIPMLEELGRPFALQDDVIQSDHFTAYVTGSAFNEWYVPNGLDRAISVRAYGQSSGWTDLGPNWTSTLVGNILLGSSAMASGAKSSVARTMLTLVHPAFEAAVRSMHQRLTMGSLDVTGALTPALESLDRPFWFFDGDGRCIHQSKAASELVGRLGEGDVLEAATKQLARSLAANLRLNEPVASTWTIFVSDEKLRLSAGLLPDTDRSKPLVMVRAEGLLPLLPTEAALQSATGLTGQEARIATMLAMGASPAIIAERLSVTIHTIRRHTEGILAKLEVRRTAEVGPRLLQIRSERAR